MKIKITQVHISILFAILFITIGWVAPAAYASYAPESEYIEVNSFTASDTTVDDDTHTVCLDRNVKTGRSGTVFTEMYLVDDGERRVEVRSQKMARYFQEGDSIVKSRFDLPRDVEAGTYKYLLIVQMDLVQGRVQREFVFESETFEIAGSNERNITSNTCT